MSRDDMLLSSLSSLKETFSFVEDLIPDNLIVVYDDSDCWMDFIFLEFCHADDTGEYYKEFCKVSGPSDGLRECRHTYFPDNGYLFYMNSRHMRAMLDFLDKFYDMD